MAAVPAQNTSLTCKQTVAVILLYGSGASTEHFLDLQTDSSRHITLCPKHENASSAVYLFTYLLILCACLIMYPSTHESFYLPIDQLISLCIQLRIIYLVLRSLCLYSYQSVYVCVRCLSNRQSPFLSTGKYKFINCRYSYW